MITLRFDRGTLLLDGVPRDDAPPEFVWDGRVQRLRGPAQAYHDLVLGLHRSKVRYADQAKGWDTLPLTHDTPKTPRDYQAGALQAWQQAGRRGVVSLPTGSGKSFVAELCIAACQRPTLVVAPTIDLVNQWAMNLQAAFGGPIGVLGGGQHELGPITVSTYDSAYLHMERYGDRFGLVVFDEVHHLPADAYAQIAELMLAPFRLGLSATIERPDGLHERLDRLVGPRVYEKSISELSGRVLADYRIERIGVCLTDQEHQRYLECRATFRGFIASRGIRLGGQSGWGHFLREAARSKAGRAAFKAHLESRRLMHATGAKLDALDEILAEHRGQRCIVFTNDNATVYTISRDFGIPCITHQTGAAERREVLEGFGEGRYTAVVTSRVLNEGVDIPAAEVGVVLSGTSTVREHVQRLGRILRPKEGKQAVLYEVVSLGTSEERASERRNEHEAMSEG
ncbi:MAG: DEAD/DEAH box helicase family protein [Myxococcota bacterium]|nr:DEAD/DEAH box helicase family protein [Myxococcota bacterium]